MTDNSDYSQYKILAVDDHQLSLKLITKQLEILGFKHIDLVMNGQEGIESLTKSHYDIVIFDWAMPVMDGQTFLRLCRENPAYNNIAFVMVSSETQNEIVLDVLRSGATSYVPKPVTMDDMKDKMSKVVDWIKSRKNS